MDDALQSTAEYWPPCWGIAISQLDSKFRREIDLLSDFAKDFPLTSHDSHPNIGGTVTGNVEMSVKSKSSIVNAHRIRCEHRKILVDVSRHRSYLKSLPQLLSFVVSVSCVTTVSYTSPTTATNQWRRFRGLVLIAYKVTDYLYRNVIRHE